MNYEETFRQRIIGTTARLRYSPDLNPIEQTLAKSAALRGEQLTIVDHCIERHASTFNHFGYGQVRVPLLLFRARARIASPLHFTVV